MSNLDRYKKTYEGDYTKSYRNHAAWMKESMDKIRAYEEISKKTNTKYNKAERSDYQNITDNHLKNSERVFADGSKYKKESPRTTKRDWEEPYSSKPKSSTTANPAKPQQPASNSQSTVEDIAESLRESARRHSQQTEQRTHPTPVETVEVEDDGNYNYFDYPIQQTGINSYKNLKTGKILNADEARKILKIAGFTPKASSPIGSIIFGFIIGYFVFPTMLPFLIIGYGAYKMLIRSTKWVKHTGKKFLQFTMEATADELAANRKMGIAFIVAGIVYTIYKYGM